MAQTTPAGGNFDWIAPVYDALARVVFGQRLQQAQLVWLRQQPSRVAATGASVLIVGGGTGWLLKQVLQDKQNNPPEKPPIQSGRILYLEASAQMVHRASQRMVKKGLLGSVEFRVGNETDLRTDEQFDVIMTPFLLDVFSETTLGTRVIPRLRNALKPGGLWIVTDFVRTDVRWQKALLWSMIRFFRFTTGMEARQLADWQRLLAACGLRCQGQQSQVGGMVSAELWTR